MKSAVLALVNAMMNVDVGQLSPPSLPHSSVPALSLSVCLCLDADLSERISYRNDLSAAGFKKVSPFASFLLSYLFWKVIASLLESPNTATDARKHATAKLRRSSGTVRSATASLSPSLSLSALSWRSRFQAGMVFAPEILQQSTTNG
jgi:hypothetical protein